MKATKKSEPEKWRTRCFKNTRKKADTHPDFTGEITIRDLPPMTIAIWQYRAANGVPYLSIDIRPAKPRTSNSTQTPAEAAVAAGETWPCPSCGKRGVAECELCHGTGVFDPRVLVDAKATRISRSCTAEDAAAELDMQPQRFVEMESGQDVSPDSYGGRRRRPVVAVSLVRYLAGLRRPAGDIDKRVSPVPSS